MVMDTHSWWDRGRVEHGTEHMALRCPCEEIHRMRHILIICAFATLVAENTGVFLGIHSITNVNQNSTKKNTFWTIQGLRRQIMLNWNPILIPSQVVGIMLLATGTTNFNSTRLGNSSWCPFLSPLLYRPICPTLVSPMYWYSSYSIIVVVMLLQLKWVFHRPTTWHKLISTEREWYLHSGRGKYSSQLVLEIKPEWPLLRVGSDVLSLWEMGEEQI